MPEPPPPGGSWAAPTLAAFYNIPFARPPLGSLRFQPPVPLAASQAVFPVNESRISCAQLDGVVGYEDCLYFDAVIPWNVTTNQPTGNGSSLLGRIWIYGGGYVFGDKEQEGLYSPLTVAARTGVAHFNLNYRLGVLGFAAFEGVKVPGSAAILDQRQAIQVIGENAPAFGVRPRSFMLYGESAGAFSVCVQLALPEVTAHLAVAVMESGNCVNPAFFQPIAEARAYSKSFAVSRGCTDLKCLPSLSALEPRAALAGGGGVPSSGTSSSFPPPLFAPVMPWGPAIGAPALLSSPPGESITSTVPLIVGTNENEGDLFLSALPLVVGVLLPLDESAARATLRHVFQRESLVSTILERYDPLSSSYNALISTVLRDWFFLCPAHRFARRLSSPVFLYHFTFNPGWVDSDLFGEYHSAELEFVFGNPWPPLLHAFTERDWRVSTFIMDAWASLLRTGTPGPTWPRFVDATNISMVIDDPPFTSPDVGAATCAFWDALSPSLTHSRRRLPPDS
jgi:para-nitrobenzyl esterase